ncbi:hypothetical protein, partial [Mesorhizobium sp. M8A.F.Ca.ET.202.01.1.1]|uniref:hypothetical protein n=1 Tax=Mesorhizobium sp. M8A.F.Ca.ET.202.01.1.1 TaxID=2563967 RepID=UPI001AEDB277
HGGEWILRHMQQYAFSAKPFCPPLLFDARHKNSARDSHAAGTVGRTVPPFVGRNRGVFALTDALAHLSAGAIA